MRHGPDGTREAADALHVHRIKDARSGLRAVIALDAPELGPAVGGCRMRPYPDLRAAAREAGELARAMTRKVLLAGLPLGGGKAVVLGDPRHDKTAARWTALGQAIERLEGRCWTGEDSGTTPADMDAIGRACRYVLGRSAGAGLAVAEAPAARLRRARLLAATARRGDHAALPAGALAC